MGYYGMRKKREIDLTRFRQDDQVSSIKWSDEEELEEGYEYEEVESDLEEKMETAHDSNSNSEGLNQEHFILDGKPFRVKSQKRKQSFAETHVRTTTYLEKNVHQIIRLLQNQNQIESITKFINDSIKHYLTTKYSE